MEPEERFEAIFRANADRVMAYAVRRAPPGEADEVVAETFLVAWRRLGDVPERALPWLLGVARKVLANTRRASRRRGALTLRLEVAEGRRVEDPDHPGDLDLRMALQRLAARDREAFELLAWDGLTVAEAADVLGCSRGTLAVRLHRARRKLARELDGGCPIAISPVPPHPYATKKEETA